MFEIYVNTQLNSFDTEKIKDAIQRLNPNAYFYFGGWDSHLYYEYRIYGFKKEVQSLMLFMGYNIIDRGNNVTEAIFPC